MEFIWIALFGLGVGIIARLLMPGKDSMGLIMTAVLGVCGSLLGTYLGRTVFDKGDRYQAKWWMSILGALILLFLYRVLFKKRE